MKRTKIFVDMDGVLVNFQSGIDKLDQETLSEYADDGKGDCGENSLPQWAHFLVIFIVCED